MEPTQAIPKVFVSRETEQEIGSGLRSLRPFQIEKVKGDLSAGTLAWVVGRTGKFIGQGFTNPGKEIAFQIVSIFEKEKIDAAFFEARVLAADEFRQKTLKFSDAYRLFYGAADGIPGLVIDRFNNICSLQISCPGVEKYKQAIADALMKINGVDTVIERNDFRNREKLGLAVKKGVLAGKARVQTVINEGGVKFEVDVMRGHKTGFYLDQAENRVAAEKYCFAGCEMLDVFSYTGGFGLHAANANASVTMVDMKEAIGQARRNVKLNKFEERVSFIEGEAFEETKKLISRPERFDVVSVDPPAFIQKPSEKARGKKAYHQINYNCMKLLVENGVLVTSSCSHFLSMDSFLKILGDAASNAGKVASIIELRSQSRDHLMPLHGGSAASYLKCAFLRVNSKKS
ncbi:MAG TPA: class I SAM-dependent rRNA methyltransferase [Candidatus Diapherotrites archaeon]|uniref:Class I SAM-dependent rRNA methyltransferase n=1 Tax=Candidatus Iainarchaeum sp. TaxID=3101447 RepID=A0A7J4J0V5_9ARCH|nr:class I SAM-dependent rRNA methyltransferase [Candidatus Diapherotrites archaeon]